MADPSSTFDVFIENEAGSTLKNTFDEVTLEHRGSRQVAAAYPFPYGFVRGTKSADGDALDCFVVTDQAYKSGDTVSCTAVHLLEQIEDGLPDHKILAVPAGADAEIDPGQIAMIFKFIMTVFSDVPGKRMQLGDVQDADAAVRAISAMRLL